LLAFVANFAIPVTRFGGFVWLILVALRLPKQGVEAASAA